MSSDLIADVISYKYTNQIFHSLPRILIKLSLEDKKYYNALLSKTITKETIINELDSISSVDELESKIIEILKEKELI